MKQHETVEAWAEALVRSTDLRTKLSPPPPPAAWAVDPAPVVLTAPGRPPELRVAAKAPRHVSDGALRDKRKRAQIFHTFLHHELQAAELMAWAILAFPETPLAFRRGLLGICKDELRHVGMYAGHLARLGSFVGEFEVRDWFWSRVPTAPTPTAFVATMGMGFEGANLDHAVRFERRLRLAGDEEGAAIQRTIAEEEVPHVAFALHWFRVFEGDVDFDRWRASLPAPLSPLLMRGRPMEEESRRRAGFDATFTERLATWDEDLRR